MEIDSSYLTWGLVWYWRRYLNSEYYGLAVSVTLEIWRTMCERCGLRYKEEHKLWDWGFLIGTWGIWIWGIVFRAYQG